MPHSKGFRSQTRRLLSKKRVSSVTPLLREYKAGDKVLITIDASQVKGMPHRRFHGRVGVVEEVCRRSLTVKVRVGGKEKTVVDTEEDSRLRFKVFEDVS